MNQILFATDFSARDRHAFEMACQIAKSWHARLLIVHVNDLATQSRGFIPHRLNPVKKIYEIVPKDLGIAYEYVVRSGDPAVIIHEIEQEYDVDLIVVGTHGRDGMERVFAGSVAEKVIRTANCPVLTSRKRGPRASAKVDHRKKILVATDFSAHSYAALDFASLLAHTMNGEITILYVDDSVESNAKPEKPGRPPGWSVRRQQIWHQLKELKPGNPRVNCVHQILVGTAADEITDFAQRQNHDFIVLGTHGRTGVNRVLMGSVAEQVIRKSACPVFTVKPSNKRHPILN